MKFTHKSRTLGPITFSRPGRDYVYADLNGKPGVLGVQICRYGETRGHALTATGFDQARFVALCRQWVRVRQAKNRRAGLTS